jgi:hypothetical protein
MFRATQTSLMNRPSYLGGLTALAGGAQAGTALTADVNEVNTVATAADSVQLPAGKQGATVFVRNNAAANSMNVFPQTGESINAAAANAAFAVAANKSAIFVCMVDGRWAAVLSA